MTNPDSLKQFFEHTPIGVQKDLAIKLGDFKIQASRAVGNLVSGCTTLPRIYIYCDECGGNRNFNAAHVQNPTSTTRDNLGRPLLFVGTQPTEEWRRVLHHTFVRYRCGDCQRQDKVYAVVIEPLVIDSESQETDSKPTGSEGPAPDPPASLRIMKVGEVPKPTKPLNKRIKRLIDAEWDLYRKGADDEAAGNGIGAFAYYRRVVENSRDILVDAICQVMEKLGQGDSDIEKIRDLKSSRNFSEAVEGIKGLIPQSLYLAGRDPLTALYVPLSDGLHNKSDAECLEAATSIRCLLDHFGERLQEIIESEDGLRDALKHLDSFRRGER
jgi:hypothetical protein